MKGSLLLYNLKLNCLIFSTGLNGSLIIFIRTYTVNYRNALDRLRVRINIILLFIIFLWWWNFVLFCVLITGVQSSLDYSIITQISFRCSYENFCLQYITCDIILLLLCWQIHYWMFLRNNKYRKEREIVSRLRTWCVKMLVWNLTSSWALQMLPLLLL